MKLQAGHYWLFTILIWVAVWALAGLKGVMIFAALIAFWFLLLVIAGNLVSKRKE